MRMELIEGTAASRHLIHINIQVIPAKRRKDDLFAVGRPGGRMIIAAGRDEAVRVAPIRIHHPDIGCGIPAGPPEHDLVVRPTPMRPGIMLLVRELHGDASRDANGIDV